MKKYQVVTSRLQVPDLTEVSNLAMSGWEIFSVHPVLGESASGWVFIMVQDQVARSKPAPEQ